MFICDSCHKKIYKVDCLGFFRSFGRCENCGHASGCSDCHCPVPTRPKKSKGTKSTKSTKGKVA